MLLSPLLAAVFARAAPPPPEPSACAIPDLIKVKAMKYPYELLSGPASAAVAPAWRSAMQHYRKACLAAANASRAVWHEPSLAWTESSFVQPLIMPFDRALYNHSSGQWTVEAFLDGLALQYGGVDSVLLWPVVGVLPPHTPHFAQQDAQNHNRGCVASPHASFCAHSTSPIFHSGRRTLSWASTTEINTR